MEIQLNSIEFQALAAEISGLIEQGKQAAARAVNSALTLLYWQVGRSIRRDLLQSDRADYGKQVVALLSRQLTTAYGAGWSEKHLRHCIQFADVFHDDQIVSTVWRQLSWSHIKLLIYMDDPLKRDFYLQIAQMEGWSVRTLQERIQSMLYERTAISRKPEATIAQDLANLQEAQHCSPMGRQERAGFSAQNAPKYMIYLRLSLSLDKTL